MTIISNEAGETTASLAASVTQSVQKYFFELKGTDPVDLYQFVLEEIETPEVAIKRMCRIYKVMGHSDAWIELRIHSIMMRDKLIREWQNRGVEDQLAQAILTADISQATFGMTPAQFKDFKGLDEPGDNLRDHMTDLELILCMLGEFATTEIARCRNSHGFLENRDAALSGGTVAGNTRLDLEQTLGRSVLSQANFEELSESALRKQIPRK